MPVMVNDAVPGELEIRTAARRLRNGRAGGISGIRAEDIKAWLRAAIAVEQGDPPLGDETAGNKWDSFAGLIQSIWRTGDIPQQMTWMTMVLLPNGNGEYHGIGLLEPF